MMASYQQTVVAGADCALPMFATVEVLVCGGGPAGVAAAETAATRGRKTMLIERLGFLGGEATAGYSGTIAGMFYSSDTAAADGPEQAVFGWCDHFYRHLQSAGAVTAPQLYGKTYLVPFEPIGWRQVAEDLVLASGAEIVYHTSIVGVIKDGETLLGVIIDTASGLAQIRADIVIDATGDATVIARAGLATTQCKDGVVQNPSMIFRLGGVNVAEFKKYWGVDTISPQKVSDAIRAARRELGIDLPREKVWVYPTTRPNELFMNVTLITGARGESLNALSPWDHTQAEIRARLQVRDYARFFKVKIPGCADSFVADLAPHVGIRQSRSIVGLEQLTDEDVAGARKRKDGIVRCPWPIELHNGGVPYMHWLLNDYYEVPYGALVPAIGEHILVAGRNLCAEHEALASCRVTAQCFGYGQAAAIAADLALTKHTRLASLKGEQIRSALNASGARLEEE